MHNASLRRLSQIREFVFLSVSAILCAALLVAFIQISGVNRNPKAGFREMLNGTAYKPYVYRVLVPGVVRGVLSVLPVPLEDAARSWLTRNQTIQRWLFVFNAPRDLGLEALLVWIIMYFSLLGFCYSIRYLLSITGGFKSSFSIDLSTLFALIPLFLFFGFGYIYDFTTLFLFTLALAWMAQKKWLAYLSVFVLACVNKETAILLPLVFFTHYKDQNRMPRLRFLTLLVVQVIIYALVKGWLFFEFRNNPGELVEIHLTEYQMVLQKQPWVGIISLFIFAILLLLVFRNWKHKPLFLRHALIMVLPLLALIVAFGFPYEFRVFYEVYPVFSSLAILNIAR
ncbi:MAG: hypothetical protein WHV66_06675 [Anaerolineales bacterium]